MSSGSLSSGTTVTDSTVTRVYGASASTSSEHSSTTVRSCHNGTADRAYRAAAPHLTVPRAPCALLSSPALAAPCSFSCPGWPRYYMPCSPSASALDPPSWVQRLFVSRRRFRRLRLRIPLARKLPRGHVPKLMTFEALRLGMALEWRNVYRRPDGTAARPAT
jgi:hypothetical protein